jgi:tRNA (cmo5U34)-methyltransferase
MPMLLYEVDTINWLEREEGNIKMIHLEKMDEFFNVRFKSYDEVHTSGIDGGMESKNVIANLLPPFTEGILDIGIGTGLELQSIFNRFPEMHVTGIDIADNMLNNLKEKYKKEYERGQINLLHMSYLDYEYKKEGFDSIISVMTLHHYNHKVKTDIYRNIRSALKDSGVYIESDYMISELLNENPQALEDEYFRNLEILIEEQGLDEKNEYHYDTPCTVPNQVKMLYEAGFSKVEIMHRFSNTTVLRCTK